MAHEENRRCGGFTFFTNELNHRDPRVKDLHHSELILLPGGLPMT